MMVRSAFLLIFVIAAVRGEPRDKTIGVVYTIDIIPPEFQESINDDADEDLQKSAANILLHRMLTDTNNIISDNDLYTSGDDKLIDLPEELSRLFIRRKRDAPAATNDTVSTEDAGKDAESTQPVASATDPAVETAAKDIKPDEALRDESSRNFANQQRQQGEVLIVKTENSGNPSASSSSDVQNYGSSKPVINSDSMRPGGGSYLPNNRPGGRPLGVMTLPYLSDIVPSNGAYVNPGFQSLNNFDSNRFNSPRPSFKPNFISTSGPVSSYSNVYSDSIGDGDPYSRINSDIFAGGYSNSFSKPYLDPYSRSYPYPSSPVYLIPSSNVYPDPYSKSYVDPFSSPYSNPSSGLYADSSSRLYLDLYSKSYSDPYSIPYLNPSSRFYPDPYTKSYSDPFLSSYSNPSSRFSSHLSSKIYADPDPRSYPFSKSYSYPSSRPYSNSFSRAYPDPYSKNYVNPYTKSYSNPYTSFNYASNPRPRDNLVGNTYFPKPYYSNTPRY